MPVCTSTMNFFCTHNLSDYNKPQNPSLLSVQKKNRDAAAGKDEEKFVGSKRRLLASFSTCTIDSKQANRCPSNRNE